MDYKEASALNREFHEILKTSLTPQSVRRAVEIIGLIGSSDDEVAHGMEDELYLEVLMQIGGPLASEAVLTQKFDFSRWCA